MDPMKTTTTLPFALAMLVTLGACGSADEDDPAKDSAGDTGDTGTTGGPGSTEALAWLEAKAGVYEGTWEMLGLDATDAVIPAMTWTDVATAINPQVTENRAFLDVTDEMLMDDGSTFTSTWIEGILVNDDGSLGEQFFESMGELSIMEETTPDHFRYETAVSSGDLYAYENIDLGNMVSGVHVTDKDLTYVDGIETHHITRVTRIEYTGADGLVAIVEFESLSGTHRKVE